MISVILVTYNSMNVLPNCLQSLKQCSNYQDLEIVFVDNNSTDGTYQWIENCQQSFILHFAGVQILKLTDNKGYAYANNRGADISNGNIILLLNPDTLVGHNAIEACSQKLITNGYGAIGCRLELSNGRLDKACKRTLPTLWNSFCHLCWLSQIFPKSKWFSKYNLTYLDDRKSYSVECLSGAFLMTPREVFLEVGCLDEDYFMYGEDIDFCYRLNQAGYAIWYEGTETTIHFKGGNGGKRTISSLNNFYSAMYIYFNKRCTYKIKAPLNFALKVILCVLFNLHRILLSSWLK